MTTVAPAAPASPPGTDSGTGTGTASAPDAGAPAGRETSGPGILYLVPTPLTQDPATAPPWLVPTEQALIADLRHFAVETPKVARGWLGRLLPGVPVREIEIRALPDSGAAPPDWADWLAPLRSGQSIGLMSDAGCPGVADPGAALVAAAHEAGFRVRPLVGPNSILLLLMASGLQGQRFAFHGYLPVAPAEREQAIRALAREARERDETEIVIETPYRNQALAESLVRTLPPDAVLVIGQDLNGADEQIVRRTVLQWRRDPPTLGKTPASFLFGFAPRAAGIAPAARGPTRSQRNRRPPPGASTRAPRASAAAAPKRRDSRSASDSR